MGNLRINKVGSAFAVEYFSVTGSLDNYTDTQILHECAEKQSYGRVFRNGRRSADVEVYEYEEQS